MLAVVRGVARLEQQLCATIRVGGDAQRTAVANRHPSVVHSGYGEVLVTVRGLAADDAEQPVATLAAGAVPAHRLVAGRRGTTREEVVRRRGAIQPKELRGTSGHTGGACVSMELCSPQNIRQQWGGHCNLRPISQCHLQRRHHGKLILVDTGYINTITAVIV